MNDVRDPLARSRSSRMANTHSDGLRQAEWHHERGAGAGQGNLVGGRMRVEGRLARFVYVSLYRMHLIAIHGWIKGLALIVVGHVNQVVRPKLKLH